MYSFDSRVRYSEVGWDNHLKVESVIDYFQDCSNFQSEDLGVGIDWLLKNKRCWVINSWQVKFRRFPSLGEHITISTWPNAMNGFMGTRNFMLSDEKGEMLAVANSTWTYMDLEKQRPTRICDELLEAYPLEPAYEGEWMGRKIKVPEKMSAESPFPVQLNHLDTNNHVNNGQYIQMAAAYLPKDFKIHEMRVEYRSAAVYGDVIFPYINKEEKCVTISLAKEDGAPYAVVEFKTE